MKTAVIIIFLLVYVALLVLPKWRALIALVGGALMLCIGAIPLENVMQYLDFNVLLMLFGTMGLVYYFIESKMPAFLAERIAQKTKTVRATVIALSAFAGIISAFVDNVATVLMVAPIALAICKKLKVNPVPFIIYDNFSSSKYSVKLGREDFGLSSVAATTVNMLGFEAPEIWDESMIELC
jgi:Na+/H+ antiporter NhaD/arsenite permease-like protein